MEWTEAELRAIAEGETAADNSGAMPEALSEPERAAWRQGYARGWNGLGQPRQVDIPEHTFELLDELCRRLRRPRDVVLVHIAEAMREATIRRES